MNTALSELPKAFAVPFARLGEWSVRSFFSIDWRWSEEYIQPLSAALRRKRERVDKDEHPFDTLQFITLHFDGSMEPRDMGGKKRFKGRLYFAEPGDVVYSRIDVRHGAIGVVPNEMGRAAVSSEYPVYAVRPQVALPHYVKLVFRMRQFRQLVNSMISGASGRKRVKPTQMERIEVPLPPLEVQHAIISRHRQARAETRRLREEAEALEASLPDVLMERLGITRRKNVQLPKCFALPWEEIDGRLTVNVLARIASGVADFKTSGWETAPLGALCDGRSGNTPRKGTKRYWGGDVPWVSPKDMKRFAINGADDHITAEALQEGKAPRIPEGSILIVVRSGILQHTVPVALTRRDVSINQDIRAFTPRDERILPDFLAVYLRAKQLDLLRLVKSSTTVQSINREWLEDYPIPIPPKEVQHELIELFRDCRREAAQCRAEADARERSTREAVEAMILGTRAVGEAPAKHSRT